jgi:hypothetical protein
MANAGVSQEIRQKLTVHASAQMKTIYTHHELEPLRAAIARIPAVGVYAMATCQLKRGDDRSVRGKPAVSRSRLNQRSGGVEGSIVVRADLYLSKFQKYA